MLVVSTRYSNLQGHEVSGYIDLAHRMRSEDFVPVFEMR